MIALMSVKLSLISRDLSRNQKTDPLSSSVIRRDFTLPIVDLQDVIRDGNAPVHQLERVRGVPVSLFSDREAEQLAFPFLSPDGTMGIAQREIHPHQHWIPDTPPE